jgi:signal transduction histidine kinase
MARSNPLVLGKSLADRGLRGSAYLSRAFVQPTLRRAALTAVSVAAFVAGVTSLAVVVNERADPGVVTEAPGGHVLAVSSTGYAWAAGVRSGQSVVSVTPSDVGWELVTTDGSQAYRARAAPADQALRDSWPFAAGSLALGAISLLFRKTRRDWVVPAAAAALLLAAVPLWLQGIPPTSTAAMAACLAVPGGWLAANSRAPGWLRAVLLVGLSIFLAVWILARLSGSDPYGELEFVRGQLAVLATGAVLGVRVVRPAFEGQPMNLVRPAFVDLVVVAAFALLSVSLVVLDVISPVVLGIGALLGLALLPPLRRRLWPRLERSVFGDLRAHARAEGADEERARLARELHDDHLQELTGVIRRLEVKPGTESEQDDLRDLAARLRAVASSLRPPVLDDFGLHAALESIAEQATTAKCRIKVDVTDLTGFERSQRPPEDIELAMYRITGEAVGNAIKHAKASEVVIRGQVSPDAVALEIADDGVGVTDEKMRAAIGQNRMGVASMRRRAAAIDADFSISGSRTGTLVRASWHR